MARRSYLARIAQPVRPGEPLVWSIPHPPAEEARPPAMMSTPFPAPATAQPPAPTPARPPIAPTTTRRTDTALGPPRPPMNPAATARDAPGERVPSETAGEIARPPARLFEVEATNASAPPVEATAAPHHTAPGAGEAPSTGSPDTAAALRMKARPQPSQDRLESTLEPPLRPPASSPPQLVAASIAAAERPLLADAPLPPAPPARLSATRREDGAAPRLHIGTIEIRAPEPAPPPEPVVRSAANRPAPSPATIGRAYPWRYGLVQG